ncbi:hypothetical protein [Streptomyces sp. NBC_00102]|uniref:hypothetical protein n=1 Tax=Streptomyces sp. NBC_00102 TaxID=2975652 RepID=UPI0022562EC2|nr:hypothetical protein [Streptomyces sp. NBC_00102]MCX5398780.1 hypothetical protein [Streptomyces sp. NBC_00102]
MGSLRKPVGPLPSSIYWRRRVVAAILVALLAALLAWVFLPGTGHKKSAPDAKPGSSEPARSITPGPSDSGPAISQQPGGRHESGGGDSDGASSDGSTDGANGDDATTSPSPGADASADAASGGTAPAAGTKGIQVPANSALPDCRPAAVQLSVRTKVTYGPEETPKFELIAKNTSTGDCKADLGPKTVVLTVTDASGDDDDQVWSSKDCPAASGSLYFKVPAGQTVIRTIDWNRARSTPGCATPRTGKAAPGTYLLEAEAPGEPLQRASFVLAKD